MTTQPVPSPFLVYNRSSSCFIIFFRVAVPSLPVTELRVLLLLTLVTPLLQTPLILLSQPHPRVSSGNTLQELQATTFMSYP